jgi:hypothetical protein
MLDPNRYVHVLSYYYQTSWRQLLVTQHTYTYIPRSRRHWKGYKFLQRAFGAKEIYGNYTPDGKSIIHAEIKTGDSVLMMSDELPHIYC